MDFTIIPAFAQLSKMDFGPSYLETIGRKDQITIGFWIKEGCGWDKDDLEVKWTQTEEGLKMEVEDHDPLEDHSKIKAFLNNSPIGPEDLRNSLLNLGYRDVSDIAS